MNTQDNEKRIEQELAALDNQKSGAGSESLDSDHEGAEQEEGSPEVSISVDDFEAPAKNPEPEKKTISKEENALNIQDKTFQKYGIEFENYPEDLKWTIEGIKERYTKNPISEEKEEIDINSLVEKGVNEKLAEQDFKNQLQNIVNDENLTAEQKISIKETYLNLREKGISSKIEALNLARQIAGVNVEPKKIIGVFPTIGNPPKTTIKTITQKALEDMDSKSYEIIRQKIDNGEVQVV